MSKKILFNLSIFLSGCLLTLAFSPFDLWIFSILSPAFLLWACDPLSAKHAFLKTVLFGLGFFGSGVSWVYISLHDYGQADIGLAALMTFLMVLVLLSYTAFAFYVLNRYFPASKVFAYPQIGRYLLVFPSLWVLAEWARGWVFTGFPWLFLGYTQLKTPLSGWAPIVSVYGISWMVAATAGLLVFILRSNLKLIFYP